MARILMGFEKVCSPSLTARFIELYMKFGITDEFESIASQILPAYCVHSLQMAVQSLEDNMATFQADENVSAIRRNGFVPQEGFYTPLLGGNGLFTITMSVYPAKKDSHDISYLDHASNQTTHLGYFPAYGFYENRDQFGWCCPREPRVLCGVTQDGNNCVLFGPCDYLSPSSSNKTPVIAVYQISPLAMRVFKKSCKNTPFLKCDPIGIALHPPSVMKSQYHVAIVTRKMAVMFLNVETLEHSTLQLEFVSPGFWANVSYRNPQDNCVNFSPDGQFISMLCFMQCESIAACLIIDVFTLEPICWMAADGGCSWLRWLFPMFSACGTKLILSTYSDHENVYDETKYELMCYKIAALQTLKVLCRAVILENIKLQHVDQLPLSQDLIRFLGGGKSRVDEVSLHGDESRTCKCNLF